MKVINFYEKYESSYDIFICLLQYTYRAKYQKDRTYANSEKCLNGGAVLNRSLISLSHTMKVVLENKIYVSVSCFLSRSA